MAGSGDHGSAAAEPRYEEVWLAEHAREVPCALAAYRDGERHDEASRRAGVADPFTQATPTIRSLCKPRLGQQASWGLPGTGTVPDPVTAVSDPITVLSDPITVLSDPITVLSDPITVLACLLPVTSKYDTVLSNPITVLSRPTPFLPSFLTPSTEYLPTLYLKCACHKHNDILLRPLRRLTYVMYVSFVVVNLLNRLS